MRLPHWEFNLHLTVHEWRKKSFKWGETDCVHFTCACVKAMTDKDYLVDISLYTNEREALDVLADYGADDMLIGVETVLGPSIRKTHLSKGDVVLARRPVVGDLSRTGPGIGICLGNKAVFIAANGLDDVLMSSCICGWKIE